MRNKVFRRARLSGKGLYDQLQMHNANSHPYGRFTIESFKELLKEMEYARTRKT